MPRFRCGLIGCGTVGSGVVRLWADPAQSASAALAAVAVRHLHKPRAVDLSRLRVTDDAWSLVRDPSIDILIEATGDTELGHALAVEALSHGKRFVTAGKNLVARHGLELEELAAAHGTCFRYEAAAGGALPIVALLQMGLSPGPVRGMAGVLNGTCNFVLTRLGEGLGFEEALALARGAGLAEPDSRRDTSGLDAADKLVLLARLVGVGLDPQRIPTRGIEGLGPEDVLYGRRQGLELRLVARLRTEGTAAIARVGPCFVSAHSPLAQAREEQNAILLDAGAAGVVGLVGPGAGSLPTAAAILSDVRVLSREGAPPAVARSRPRAVEIVEDATPRRCYLTLRGPTAARQHALDALVAAGISLERVESPWPGRLQALTPALPPSLVQRALAPFPNALSVEVDDETAPAPVTGLHQSPARYTPASALMAGTA